MEVQLSKFMGQSMVAITMDMCTGCDMCIPHCPFEALLPLAKNPGHRKHQKRPVIVVENHCVGCLSCIGSCPTNALYEIEIPVAASGSPLLHDSSQPDVEQIQRWKRNGLGVA
jgi:NAD-dependent dihydropyrimidine dehydrogenase PreA subunit